MESPLIGWIYLERTVQAASCADLKLLQDITATAFRSFIELTTNRSPLTP
jgi:hypothetical protein